jgi:hypothetical protein
MIADDHEISIDVLRELREHGSGAPLVHVSAHASVA